MLLKKIILFAGVSALLFLVDFEVMAGQHVAKMRVACPNAWELNDSVIPVVSQGLVNPWGQNTNDKALTEGHLNIEQPTQTLAMQPVTSDDEVNDLLTVASECLVYRNMEVNEAHPAYVPPTPTDTTRGWMPVVIF